MYYWSPAGDHDRVPADAARPVQSQTSRRRSRHGLLLLPLHSEQGSSRGSSANGSLHELPYASKAEQSPAGKVRDSYNTGKPVEWVRVHRVPDFVFFNHQAHVTVGVSCVSCHGRVDQMVEVKQMEPLNMAFCLDCHRNPAPKIRPVEQVTNLAWRPDRDPAEIGHEIIQARGSILRRIAQVVTDDPDHKKADR